MLRTCFHTSPLTESGIPLLTRLCSLSDPLYLSHFLIILLHLMERSLSTCFTWKGRGEEEEEVEEEKEEKERERERERERGGGGKKKPYAFKVNKYRS